MKLLSTSAYELLSLIDEHTKWAGDTRPGNTLTVYWVPRAGPQYVKALGGKGIRVGGAGDAAIIRKLVRLGLVTPQPVTKYACAITEEGMLALEHYRERCVYDENGHFPPIPLVTEDD